MNTLKSSPISMNSHFMPAAPAQRPSRPLRVYKDDIGIAICGLDESGPRLQYFSSSRFLDALSTESSAFDTVERFGVAAMVALIQGNKYSDNVSLLQLADFPDMKVITVSLICNKKLNLPIHEKYVMLGIVIPKDIAMDISVTRIEASLLEMLKPEMDWWMTNPDKIGYAEEFMKFLKCKIITLLNK